MFKRVITLAIIVCATLAQSSCSTVAFLGDETNYTNNELQHTDYKTTTSAVLTNEITPYLLQAGDVIKNGGYFYVGDVKFQYSNGYFDVTNNSDSIVEVWCNVIGTKKDGTYELLLKAGFGGVDVAQYNRDLEENGWAVEHFTNMVRPKETLRTELYITNLAYAPAPDINNDGYYELMFVVYPRTTEDDSDYSNGAKSTMFKLPVNEITN